jgi:hypothetical protein
MLAFGVKGSTQPTTRGTNMEQQSHLKAGNAKLHNSCLISTLPTAVCFGKGKQCAGCYALKAERQYQTVRDCRMRHLRETMSEEFVERTIEEIRKSKKIKVRIHESGDFYSQAYLDKWVSIAEALPTVRFYLYTKKELLDWTEYDKLPNTNRVHSIAPDGGMNYGDMERLEELKALGYHICPCGIEPEHYSYTLSGKKVLRNQDKICMNTCNACLYLDKVAFLKH